MSKKDLAKWRLAWGNIQADYRNGVISHHQFLKEQDYMRQARIQIEASKDRP